MGVTPTCLGARWHGCNVHLSGCNAHMSGACMRLRAMPAQWVQCPQIYKFIRTAIWASSRQPLMFNMPSRGKKRHAAELAELPESSSASAKKRPAQAQAVLKRPAQALENATLSQQPSPQQEQELDESKGKRKQDRKGRKQDRKGRKRERKRDQWSRSRPTRPRSRGGLSPAAARGPRFPATGVHGRRAPIRPGPSCRHRRLRR